MSIKTEIGSPSTGSKLIEEKDELIGRKYEFCKIENGEIRSPITGKIIKIFFDKNTILISNICGMQIILRIEIDSQGCDFKVKMLANEGKSVKKGEILFLSKKNDIIKSAIIYIPWQPLIIKRINGFKITYRNPWSSLKTKTHGVYI